MDKFFNSVQSFFQSVTTNDRYASSETISGRRTVSGGFGPAAPLTSSLGRHDDPSSQERHSSTLYRSSMPGTDRAPAPRQDHNPYSSNPTSRTGSLTNLAGAGGSSSSLNRLPYAPGMRSQNTSSSSATQATGVQPNSIPLQDYNDGLPPPPPPSLSWKRIDRWLDQHYPELGDSLEENVSNRDLNGFESDMGCSLPEDVRDSFLVHDGQERGGRPTGLVFNLTLLDLEAVSLEWENWKKTAIRVETMARVAQANRQIHQQHHYNNQSQAGPSSASSSSSSGPAPRRPGAFTSGGNLSWLDQQASVPEGAVQHAYAHTAWIPLVTDYLGNNIAVDLAPGPKGKWGQVILFGREYDTKYVVAPSWAHFLMTFADDLENGHHIISDESEEGELSYCSQKGIPIAYMDVLKARAERSYRQFIRQQQQRQQLQAHANHPYGVYKQSSNPNLAAGASPRNSMGTAPPQQAAPPVGRNVSGNYRAPRSTRAGPAEAKLISPMNSSSNLASPVVGAMPSTGLTKSAPPAVTLNSINSVSSNTAASTSGPSVSPAAGNFKSDIVGPTILEEQEEPEPVSETSTDKKKEEPSSTGVATESKDAAKKADDEAHEEAETIKEEEPKEAEVVKKTESSHTETTSSPSSSDSDNSPTTSASSTISKTSDEVAETPAAPAAKPETTASTTTHDEDESEDEVDLLKDELTEVAI